MLFFHYLYFGYPITFRRNIKFFVNKFVNIAMAFVSSECIKCLINYINVNVGPALKNVAGRDQNI